MVGTGNMCCGVDLPALTNMAQPENQILFCSLDSVLYIIKFTFVFQKI